MFLLAQMPAVVAPEADDRVVAVRGFLQRIEHAADLSIEIADRGEVALDRFLPAAGFEDARMVAKGVGHLEADGREIVDVVGPVWWKLDRFQRMHSVILLRDVPGHVGLVESHGEEERSPVFQAELLDSVIGDLRVGDRLVAAFEDAELDAADAPIIDLAVAFAAAAFVSSGGGPLCGEAESAVPELAHAQRGVAGLLELRDEGFLVRDHRLVTVLVVVDAADAGTFSGEERRARRIADRPGAVGAGEGDAHLCESINVRRLRLGVHAQVADPVVEVVDGDEENVGAGLRFSRRQRQRGEADEKELENSFHGWVGAEKSYCGGWVRVALGSLIGQNSDTDRALRR